jgi:hypothetical protein
MEEVGFDLTGMAWNRGSRFCPDWNGLEGRKSFLSDCNSLEWRKLFLVSLNVVELGKSVLACLEWLGLAEVLSLYLICRQVS